MLRIGGILIGDFLQKLEFAAFRVVSLISDVGDALILASVKIIDLLAFKLTLDLIGPCHLEEALTLGRVSRQNLESVSRQKSLRVRVISLLDRITTKQQHSNKKAHYHPIASRKTSAQLG
jgi:hypothetical protein